MHLRPDVVALEFRHRLADFLVNKLGASIAVQLQLLDAFGQRAEMFEQSILRLARIGQVSKPAEDKQPMPNGSAHDESQQTQKDLPGEPAQVDAAPEQN